MEEMATQQVGITRIKIQSDWRDRRTEMADKYTTAANQIYRKVFDLKKGTKSAKVKKGDPMALLDAKEGIDVILETDEGQLTVQEKFLNYHLHTVTIEEKKSSGELGGWFYTTAKYYFVGYVDPYAKTPRFTEWMLLDLEALREADGRGEIDWKFNQNYREGRSATFRFVEFDNVPASAILSRGGNNKMSKPTTPPIFYGRIGITRS
jgi:hypothetical protein